MSTFNYILELPSYSYQPLPILDFALKFEQNSWSKHFYWGTSDYWLEIRSPVIANNQEILNLLKPFNLLVEPQHIALHKVPKKMSMPIHTDISDSDAPARKSVLIFPLTYPCPGTRFYKNRMLVCSSDFQCPTVIRADVPHNIVNDLNFDRITLQISLSESLEYYKELDRQNNLVSRRVL